MAAINFPDTPTDGEQFTSGDRTWIWNATDEVWKALSSETSSADYTSIDAVLAGQIFG